MHPKILQNWLMDLLLLKYDDGLINKTAIKKKYLLIDNSHMAKIKKYRAEFMHNLYRLSCFKKNRN